MPSLSFEMLRVATGSDTILVKADKAGIKSVGVKGFKIPTDRNGQLWVHFARNDPSIYVSAVDVLEGRVAPDKIAGKLVLIGTSAVGLNDIKTTPVSPAMPGVEIHAQVLESALTGAVLSQPNYGIAFEFCAALVLGLLVIAFAPKFGPVTLVVVGGLFAIAADRNVLVFLHAASAADRFHLSLAVDHGDLSDADLLAASSGSRRSGGRSARPSASICRPRWSSSLRNRRKSSCSAARSAR